MAAPDPSILPPAPRALHDRTAAAINVAISYAAVLGKYTVYLTGTPKVSGSNPFPQTGRLALVGIGAGSTFSNDLTKYPVRMLCGGVIGYLFDPPDVVSGVGSLTLENIAFDGTVSGGTGRSTTLQGLVKGAASNNNFYLRIKGCAYGKSDQTTAALDLNGQVFAEIRDTYVVMCPFGMGMTAGGPGISTTSITFDKCYFSNLRQCYEVTSNVSDVTFNNTVFESCVVVGAAFNSNVKENDCYYENIGYDASDTGITTGLTTRSMGVGDAPPIAGNVVAAFTCRYGQIVQSRPVFRNTVADSTGSTASTELPGSAWAGRSSAMTHSSPPEARQPSMCRMSICHPAARAPNTR